MTVNQVALRLREIGIDLNIYETIADQDERSDCAFWGRRLYALKSDPNSNPVAIELVWDKFKRIWNDLKKLKKSDAAVEGIYDIVATENDDQFQELLEDKDTLKYVEDQIESAIWESFNE